MSMLRYIQALLLCCLALPAMAQDTAVTLYVDAGHNGPEEGTSRNPFQSIGAALNATVADRGDVVVVRPGTYEETIQVGAGETLRSEEGAFSTFITGSPNTPADLVTLGQGSQIIGFSIGETGGAAVKVPPNGSATVSNCVLYQSDIGLFVEVDAAAGAFNNTFYQNDSGIRGGLDAALSPVLNNAFAENGTGISVSGSATLDSGFNAFFANGVAVEGAPPADTDFVSNPLFVDAASHNFHLRAASNLRDTGDPESEFDDRDGTRNDVGADGGPDGARATLAPQIVVSGNPPSLSGPAPLAILFDADATVDEWGVDAFEWDFDALDGISAEGFGASVPVLYDTPGEYLVTLRARNNAGLESTTSFNVTVGTPPSIDVSADPLIGAAPLSVQFDSGFDGKQGGLLFDWDFDDDGNFDSAEENPRFTYTDVLSPGLYPVLLNVQDADQVSAQQRAFVTLAEFEVEASTAFEKGAAGVVIVNNPDSSVNGVRVSVPSGALNTPLVVGISAVPEGVLPLDPPGRLLAQTNVSPEGVRFGRDVTVGIPVGEAISDESVVRAWRFDSDSQAWLDEGIKRVQASAANPSVISFDTPQFGTFAVTLETEIVIPACGCSGGVQRSAAIVRGDMVTLLLVLAVLGLATARRKRV